MEIIEKIISCLRRNGDEVEIIVKIQTPWFYGGKEEWNDWRVVRRPSPPLEEVGPIGAKRQYRPDGFRTDADGHYLYFDRLGRGEGSRPVSLRRHYPELVPALEELIKEEGGTLRQAVAEWDAESDQWWPHSHLEDRLTWWIDQVSQLGLTDAQHGGAIYVWAPKQGSKRWILSGRQALTMNAYFNEK